MRRKWDNVDMKFVRSSNWDTPALPPTQFPVASAWRIRSEITSARYCGLDVNLPAPDRRPLKLILDIAYQIHKCDAE